MATTTADTTSLATLKRLMADNGAKRLLAKVLAANDNSKNQPYFARGDMSVFNILPAGKPIVEPGSKGNFKSKLNFAWLGRDGTVHSAPNAQLIFYPRHGEIRFSGYLQGSHPDYRPSDLLGSRRLAGRILFLGVRDDGRILGYVAGPESRLARELSSLRELEMVGVFQQVPFGEIADPAANRAALLVALCRISSSGWINSRRLQRDGTSVECNAQNCGGYTLEAELGVTPNSYSAPDFRGWEVKQHKVASFERDATAAITLMTPEPSDGFYVSEGVVRFVEEYGYADVSGRADRMNYGGVHRVGVRMARTGLTLELIGYDIGRQQISDPTGGIALVDDHGVLAAVWRFVDLIGHWKRKHSSAVYVPSMRRLDPVRQYRYSNRVRLGTGTSFERFLSALAAGRVVYDPGIKVENRSTNPVAKKRSQFRIKSGEIAQLYDSTETVDVCARG